MSGKYSGALASFDGVIDEVQRQVVRHRYDARISFMVTICPGVFSLRILSTHLQRDACYDKAILLYTCGVVGGRSISVSYFMSQQPTYNDCNQSSNLHCHARINGTLGVAIAQLGIFALSTAFCTAGSPNSSMTSRIFRSGDCARASCGRNGFWCSS